MDNLKTNFETPVKSVLVEKPCKGGHYKILHDGSHQWFKVIQTLERSHKENHVTYYMGRTGQAKVLGFQVFDGQNTMVNVIDPVTLQLSRKLLETDHDLARCVTQYMESKEIWAALKDASTGTYNYNDRGLTKFMATLNAS